MYIGPSMENFVKNAWTQLFRRPILLGCGAAHNDGIASEAQADCTAATVSTYEP